MACRRVLNTAQSIRFRAAWPTPVGPTALLGFPWDSRTTTSKTKGSTDRTFSSTAALYKGPNDSQEGKEARRAFLEALSQLQARRNESYELAMSKLVQRAHVILDEQLINDTKLSRSRQAELDRIHADMKYVHAACQYSAIDLYSRAQLPLAEAGAAAFAKFEPVAKEALVKGTKALVAGFRCVILEVFAPWFVCLFC